MAGLHQCDGGVMVDGFSVHGFDHADIVDDACKVRERIADPGAAFAMSLKLKLIRGRRWETPSVSRSCLSAVDRREWKRGAAWCLIL